MGRNLPRPTILLMLTIINYPVILINAFLGFSSRNSIFKLLRIPGIGQPM
jgi:hypothetical protein